MKIKDTVFDKDFTLFKQGMDKSNIDGLILSNYLKKFSDGNKELTSEDLSISKKVLVDIDNDLKKLLDDKERLEYKVYEQSQLIQKMRLKNRFKRLIGRLPLDENFEYGNKTAFFNIQQKIDNLSHINTAKKVQEFNQTLTKEDVINFQDVIAPVKIKTELQKKVSIIILNRNGLKHLELLFSTWDQNTLYKNYEIIIYDNNSIDKSKEFINELPKRYSVKTIENDGNNSFSKANNDAVKIAKGEYLLFLNNDIETTKGWLTHLVKTIEKDQNIGAVGAKLIYPNKDKFLNSLKIQHGGISFKYEKDFMRPINMANGHDIFSSNILKIEGRVAVTAACVLLRSSTFSQIKGYDENFVYGYEDVDLSLKLHDKGYKNLICNECILFHYEFGSQNKDLKQDITERRKNNIRHFKNKWQKLLNNKFWEEKLNAKVGNFTETKIHFAFATTEANPETRAGDFFTAAELAESLKLIGHKTSFIHVRGNPKNSVIDDDIDVLISMIDGYDVSKLSGNKNIIKVGWARNWFDRWAERPYIREFDLVLVSSEKAKKHLWSEYRLDSEVLMIGTNTNTFNDKMAKFKDQAFSSDISFTGSFWNDPRDVMEMFVPAKFESKHQVKIYGENWKDHEPFSAFDQGFVLYQNIPKVYANTKILIDDANRVTKNWGSINSRVFDALASGVLVITNGVLGNKNVFNGLLPTYQNEKELTESLKYYLENERERIKLVKILQNEVLKNHSYENRAAQLIDILRKKLLNKTINIKLPSPNWSLVEDWGDFHLACGLKREFEKLNYNVNLHPVSHWEYDQHSDINIVIRGLSSFEPVENQINILWHISHPDKVPEHEYQKFDKVFISSDILVEKLKDKGFKNVEVLHQCYDSERFYPIEIEEDKTDLIFIGNTRGEYREVVKYALNSSYNIDLYGKGWEEFIPKENITGLHIKNEGLIYNYGSSKIVLNDHWDQMKTNGFISNRIFDIAACGGFIISDKNIGFDLLFGKDKIVTYNDEKDFKLKVDYYLKNPSERNKIAKELQKIVLNKHSFEDRVRKIHHSIKDIVK
ncbi:glycosyltransferase [bacterium]|nr:glycosyltransferase [bacterium]